MSDVVKSTEVASVGEGVFTTFGDPAGMISRPGGLTSGPDGNVWFTSEANGRIGRISPDGKITTWGDPQISVPKEIVAGPDGNLWFTSSGNSRIGRVTPQGQFTFYGPTNPNDWSQPWGITVGPDGNLWFSTRSRALVRLTTAGQMTVFQIPFMANLGGTPTPDHIAASIDGGGALWVNAEGSAIVRMSLSGQFSSAVASTPRDVVADHYGRIWLPEGTLNGEVRVRRVTPPLPGTSVTFGDPNVIGGTNRIIVGPDGVLWFSVPPLREIWRMDLDGQVLSRFAAPADLVPVGTTGLDGAGIGAMTVGPDGNIWFGISNDRIGRLQVGSTVTGRVSDLVTGQPIAGAWVAQVPTAGGPPTGTVTGTDGTYTLSALTGGHLVEAFDPDDSHTGQWQPGVPVNHIQDAVPVAVGLDGASGIDFALAPTRASLVGTVTDTATHNPLAGMWVAAATANGLEAATTTGPDGIWTLPDLTPGPHLVVYADPTGAHTARFHTTTPNSPPAILDLAAGTTTRLADTIDPATAPPPGTSTIAGTVTDTANGQAVPGAWIAVLDAADYQLAGATTTARDGTYTLDLPPGTYHLEIIDPAATHTGQWYNNQPINHLDQAAPITTTNAHTTTVNATLDPATGAIDGTTTDNATHQPLGGLWVAAVNLNTGTPTATATGPDGTYTLDHLPLGNYLLVTVDPDASHTNQWFNGAPAPNSANTITLTTTHPNATINTTLQPSGV